MPAPTTGSGLNVGFLVAIRDVLEPESLRRVLPRDSARRTGPHTDMSMATAESRARELRRYTTDTVEENGSWWIPALKLAAACGLGDQGSPLSELAPELLARSLGNLLFAGGATIPWVVGRCERVPRSRMAASLATLGVRPSLLSPEERHALDLRGFVNLGPIIPPPALEALRVRLGQLFVEEGHRAGLEAHQERGAPRLSDLVNKGAAFDMCWTHPKVLAAFQHVMGDDFKVNSLNARLPLRAHGHQDLHVDWGPDPARPSQQRGADQIRAGHFFGVNSLWCLDDFTPENGCTRVVPGSHRTGIMPPPSVSATEELVLAKAGEVVVFNGHLFHGGTTNRTDQLRRCCHLHVIRRDEPQQVDQQRYLTRETLLRIPPAARTVLDVAAETSGRPRL